MTRVARTPPLPFERIEDVVDAVRAGGGRLSLARRRLLEALFAAPAPVTAEALAEQVQIGLGSVYRNLEHLEQLGVVRHMHAGHGAGLYALVGGELREHLVCEVCERVTSVDPERLDAVRRAVRDEFGFEPSFDHFPMFGRCAGCAGGGRAAPHEHRHL